MDGMNGTELAYEIRKRSGTRAPRLVLVTSMSESEQLDSVFDDGLSKPVLQDDLRRVIQGSDSSSRIEIEETEVEREFVGRPRILVAEDNPINREVMREILDELELDSDLVENGQEAIDAIEKGNYPLVLMDCQMPVLDGYEATRRIRRRTDEKAQIPIVAVTAHAVQGEREKALAAGMTDYITKPVTITRLVRMMSKYLETRTVKSERPKPNSNQPQSGKEPSPDPHRVTIADAEAPSPLDPGVRRSPTVVKLFRKTVPDQMAGLKEAIENGDSSEVKQAAHKLKGGCLALGARRMGELCASLEPFPDNAKQLMKELSAEHAVVLEGLAAEMGD
jgi:CheY-like chemotaxis protein